MNLNEYWIKFNEFWAEVHPFFKTFVVIALITMLLGFLTPLFQIIIERRKKKNGKM